MVNKLNRTRPVGSALFYLGRGAVGLTVEHLLLVTHTGVCASPVLTRAGRPHLLFGPLGVGLHLCSFLHLLLEESFHLLVLVGHDSGAAPCFGAVRWGKNEFGGGGSVLATTFGLFRNHYKLREKRKKLFPSEPFLFQPARGCLPV